jgi:hypothetical protein
VIVFLPSSVRVVSIRNLAIFHLLCAVLHFKDLGSKVPLVPHTK